MFDNKFLRRYEIQNVKHIGRVGDKKIRGGSLLFINGLLNSLCVLKHFIQLRIVLVFIIKPNVFLNRLFF